MIFAWFGMHALTDTSFNLIQTQADYIDKDSDDCLTVAGNLILFSPSLFSLLVKAAADLTCMAFFCCLLFMQMQLSRSAV